MAPNVDCLNWFKLNSQMVCLFVLYAHCSPHLISTQLTCSSACSLAFPFSLSLCLCHSPSSFQLTCLHGKCLCLFMFTVYVYKHTYTYEFSFLFESFHLECTMTNYTNQKRFSIKHTWRGKQLELRKILNYHVWFVIVILSFVMAKKTKHFIQFTWKRVLIL